jgi:peptide/nickel transport system permease protein
MPWYETMFDGLRHLILPVVVLGLVGAAATFRFVRARVLQILDQDYTTFTRATGLPNRQLIFKHIFKNALIPVVTLLGLYFPLLLGGAFIVEVIFAWPGMGRITYDAILAKDFPLLMAVNLSVAIFVIFGNVIADVLYSIVDPRIRID